MNEVSDDSDIRAMLWYWWNYVSNLTCDGFYEIVQISKVSSRITLLISFWHKSGSRCIFQHLAKLCSGVCIAHFDVTLICDPRWMGKVTFADQQGTKKMMWATDCNHPASCSFSHVVFNSALLSLLSLLCANDFLYTAFLCGVTRPYNKGQRSVAALARGRKSYLHMKSDSQLGILVKPLRHAPFKWTQKGSCERKGK